MQKKRVVSVVQLICTIFNSTDFKVKSTNSFLMTNLLVFSLLKNHKRQKPWLSMLAKSG